MDNALTPREIQARIRSGASVNDVVTETGMDPARVEAFAGPVIAEREHVARAAQVAAIRSRGEAGAHRRLGELITQRLRVRGLDADEVEWDAWRQPDLKWRVVGLLASDTEAELREAEFVFDPKARFSVAHNADARWMIGEEPPGARPEEENTVDFSDELALVRATQPAVAESPGDDVPSSDLMHDAHEDTSQLDRLYDMLSGISEDSVRIYTGFDDQPSDQPATEPMAQDEQTSVDDENSHDGAVEPRDDEAPTEVPDEPVQDPLVHNEPEAEDKPVKRKRRAKVPSWDEIMFGGPTQ